MPPLTKPKKNIKLLSVLLAVTFWFVDALIDSIISEEGITFLESSFKPSADELWMRGFVILLFLIFAAYTERMLNVISKVTNELKQYQDRLEYTVNELQMEMVERKVAIQELERLAITDPLTSLYNRRKFNELLSYEIDRNQRYQAGLSLIMCDIDHFKLINDKFGHDMGDHVLKLFAEKINKNIREVDIFARWGGEEFMILMPNANLDNAFSVAEKLRTAIESSSIKNIESLTASFGVTHYNPDDTIESFVTRADKALYEAKQKGRNKVAIAQ